MVWSYWFGRSKSGLFALIHTPKRRRLFCLTQLGRTAIPVVEILRTWGKDFAKLHGVEA
jgi:hypothetical protein